MAVVVDFSTGIGEFQLQKTAETECVFQMSETEFCGWGVEATEYINQGDFVIEYTGGESARCIPDLEKVSGHTGIVKLSRTPIELKSSVWNLKVVPGVGGRIISMEHLPSELEFTYF